MQSIASEVRGPERLRISRIESIHDQKVALVIGARQVNFAELKRDVARRVALLRDERAPVALVAHATYDSLLWLYAAMDAQLAIALVHPRWSASQMSAYFTRFGITRLAEANALRSVAPDPRIAPTQAEPGPSLPLAPGTQFLLTTSGSSGPPKAVQLSLGNLFASAEASARNVPWRHEDRWLLSLPFAHIGGLSVITRCLEARLPVVVASGRFDDAEFVEGLQKSGVTTASLVPTQLSDLLRLKEQRSQLWSNLRVMLVGGAPCPLPLRARARQAGVPALYTYGMTEISSQVATQSPSALDEAEPVDVVCDVGRPLSGFEVRLDADGLLEVRGPSVMLGYWGGSSTEHGWFKTRDRGYFLGDGRLVVQGRADNVIISGGENVSPESVEAELLASGLVQGVCVIGLPHPRWGQMVVAVVQHEGGHDASAERLRQALSVHARAHLASFACPKDYILLPKLPLLASGKIDRNALLAWAATRGSAGTSAALDK